ncbi:MAG TPA: adenosylcobinamide-GDP ribazoletransferase [Nocardioidaceae bacterium]|nr:adenosylcobinamide-GDP ribazoletransferase [Nocardioidaceae bacterium]
MTAPKRGGVGDGIRLALGTLTILPTRPPGVVDRRSASWAMTFAPLIGLLLAVPAVVAIWLLDPASPLLVAVIVIGLLALLTRAIHLDGLADTVDGLGSRRPPEQALALMRKGDVGPFGVVALVLLLLVQVTALAQHVGQGQGPLAITLALALSRLMLPVVCTRGIPAAREDGLGHAVAGSVSAGQLLLALAISVLVLGAAGTSMAGLTFVDATMLRGMFAAAAALLAGAAVCLWCVRRLGGITGDVIGCCVEVTFTVALVVPLVV